MVAVTVDAGWRKDLGHSVQKVEGGETERGAAGGVGPWEEVEDLVGTTVDEAEAVESEGPLGAIPNQPLQAGAVGGLDAALASSAKAATVIPQQHILCLMGSQKTVTPESSPGPGAGSTRT